MFEKRHTRISINSTVLHDISSYHPFTQQVGEYSFFFTGEDPWSLSLSHTQIDVIFPSQCRELENALSALQTCFAKGRVDLASMFATGSEFVHPYGTSFSEGTQDTPRQVSSHSVRPPPSPPQKNKALGEILTISCLVSLPSELLLELSDKNCISWIFSCCDFFFVLLPFWKYDPAQEWPRCSESEPRLWHAQWRCLVRRYTGSVDDVRL